MMKLKNAVFTAATAMVFFSCQNNNAPTESEQTQGANALLSSYSEEELDNYFISKDSANKMLQSYQGSISSVDADSNLHSLILNAEALRQYLSDTSIKEVKVMLAHTLDYINAGHQNQAAGYKPNALTIILAGYNDKGNYVFAPGNMVPNRAKPCPNQCPTTGSASSSILE